MLRGETPALLDLPDRPPEYEDAGRSTRWGSVLPQLEDFAALKGDRRQTVRTPPSDRRTLIPIATAKLTRSAYERVFLKLGNGRPLRIDGELLTPVAVRGWYHSIFRTSSGEERMLSIDQLLAHMSAWR